MKVGYYFLFKYQWYVNKVLRYLFPSWRFSFQLIFLNKHITIIWRRTFVAQKDFRNISSYQLFPPFQELWSLFPTTIVVRSWDETMLFCTDIVICTCYAIDFYYVLNSTLSRTVKRRCDESVLNGYVLYHLYLRQ